MIATGRISLLDRPKLYRYAKTRGKVWPLAQAHGDLDLEPLQGGIRPPLKPVPGLQVSDPHPWTFKEEFVCELADVTLLGHKPLVVTCEGDYVLDSLVSTRQDNRKLEETFRRIAAKHGIPKLASGFTGRARIRDRGRRLEHACLLTDGLQRSYYHWMLEQLTKLRGVEEYRLRTGQTPTLVLPRRPPAWMFELIDLVGFGDAETFRWSGPRDGMAKRLVLPTYPEPSPTSLRWLRERVLSGLAPSTGERMERILIARGEGHRWWRRSIVNQEELEDALRPLGFKTYRLADLGPAATARLFERAEVVVGAHGAGLTNMVFSPGASVLELFGASVRPHFFRLAYVLGLPYRYQLCEPVSIEEMKVPPGAKPPSSPGRMRPPGLRVDTAQVKETLGSMGVH